jgi:hypothetical protein
MGGQSTELDVVVVVVTEFATYRHYLRPISSINYYEWEVFGTRSCFFVHQHFVENFVDLPQQTEKLAGIDQYCGHAPMIG